MFLIYQDWINQFNRRINHMAFGNKSGFKKGFKKGGFNGGFKKGGKSKNPFNNTTITGLFATKRDNLFVGTVNDLDALVALVKKARAAEKGITFFLWANDNDDFAPFNLVANVAQDRPDGIKEEDQEGQDPNEL